MRRRLRVATAIVAVLLAPLAVAADWTSVPVEWAPRRDAAGRWSIGGDAPNPSAALPIDRVRGRWLRFAAVAAEAESGINLVMNVYRENRLVVRSLPSSCDPALRCTTLLWVPLEATRVQAFIWASDRAGTASSPAIEVAPDTVQGTGVGERSKALLALIRSRYYRTDEADWPAIERAVDAIPAPPADVDPRAMVAQYVGSLLPGHQHTFVGLRANTRTSVATATVPTCGDEGAVAVVTLPGIGAIEGDGPARYAKALHDCLMQRDDRTPWLIDLRGNSGGNMMPMISGVAPLLAPGPLYAFTDREGHPTSRVTIDARGLMNSGARIGDPTPDVGTRTGAPVVVVLSPRCASSCEQVANALASRPRTLFVGEPTGGFTTGNVPHVIDDDSQLILTEGYTADPCGRRIEDRLVPDVAIAQVDRRTIDELLRDAEVEAWLQRMRPMSSQPVEDRERRQRCTTPRG